ncbi:TonB-dependent siderophore receptor [Burkholderia cepacia]|uniref:TonB-dependent siderophore receptor n=1 Tax=Burkholderia cepacia TaxID=292 RepID=UPI001E32542D|nr:TonB-dependent siderophore receptor [Burkholderia cepacia]
MARTRAVGAALVMASGAVVAQTASVAAAPDANPKSDVLPAVVVNASQQKDKEAERGYQAKRASVATRTDAPLIDTPQTVNVVTQQSIQDRQPDSLAEALETVPGVRMGNTLGGTLDAIIKRGFGDNRDNSILRDGMQSVNPRNFSPTTQRIEVLKGPASMLYGIQDPGGLVNVVTKKPELEAQRSVSGFTSSYGGGGAQMDLTGPIGTSGLAYRLIADHQKVDYWRNFGYTRQDTIAPSLAWYGRDTTVLLQYEHMSYAVPLDRGTVIDTRTGNPVAIPNRERLDEAYNISAGRSDSVNLRVDHKLTSNWTVHAGYGWNRTYYNDQQARVMSLNPATGVVTRRVDSTQNGVQSVHNLTLNVEGKVELFGLRHDVLAGVDYMRNYRVLADLYRGKNNTSFNLYNPVYGTLSPTYTWSATDSNQTDKLIERGAFIQDAVHFGDRWIVLGGIRYESFQELTGKGVPFVVGSTQSASKAVPHVGVVYKFTPEWSAYASYSESFRPNTSIATPIGTLPPEQALAYEIGTRWESNRLTASAALFDIRKKNIQTTQTIDGVNYTRNAGHARSRGLELEANGQITDRWSVMASYALTEARYKDDPILAGVPLPNAPKHAGAFYLTRDFGSVGFGPAATGRLRAGGGVRVFSSLTVADGNGKVYKLPYGRVVDAFVAWDSRIFGQDIDWQFNVRNLFNSTYYTSSCCTGTPFITIGESRQAILTAKLNF